MNFLLIFVLVLSNLVGFSPTVGEDEVKSVEIGLAETSPLGESGGYAIPASGCGHPGGRDHSHGAINCAAPTIEANKVLVRPSDDVVINWSTGGWPDCTLSSQLTKSADDADKTETVVITGETIFNIDCGSGGSDSVTVYMIPVIEES